MLAREVSPRSLHAIGDSSQTVTAVAYPTLTDIAYPSPESV